MQIIIVTRPSPSGEALCHALESAGFSAYHFPVLAFAPPNDPIQIPATHFDWLIFTSKQAVLSLKQWPSYSKIAAIGEATAAALNAPVDVIPKEWSSEGLLALPEFQHIKNKNIAIITGDGGRTLLADELFSRGAKVSIIATYKRIIPNTDSATLQDLLKKNQISAFICTSGESLQNLLQLVPQNIFAIPLIIVSQRLQCIAKDLGFKQIILAENASHESLVAAVKKIC
jgi:uroporphyrinogen-III synthase